MVKKPTTTRKHKGMAPGIDLSPGVKHGQLTVIRRTHLKEGLRYYVHCDCGKEFYTKAQYMTRKGNPQRSCTKCSQKKANPNALSIAERATKVCWHMMNTRCYYEKHVAYHYYGGRGITVCEEWRKSPTNPNAWANFLRDMGLRPTPYRQWTLDRKDPNLGYSKDNCRWATKEEQAANQRHKWINGRPPPGANL
jgi:hypothetical protein